MMHDDPAKRHILLVIVTAQFFCTSLWFAGNSIIPDLIKEFRLPPGILANLTSAVQFGFITGTLIFAIFTITDRFSPSLIFFSCAIIAALCNIGITIGNVTVTGLLLSRFFTGFFLAGIYPVGMKIASDYFQKGLGRSLGFLIGALVLGTAFPHLLKSLAFRLSWKYVIYTISMLSVAGGLAILLFVPDGPFRKQGNALHFTTFFTSFRNKNFSAVALGYFGHMWELYAFWTFIPVMLATNKNYHHNDLNIPLLSFPVIASGSIACVLSGILSQHLGTKRIARTSLFLSGLCCLLSPFFQLSSAPVFLSFLFLWGMAVIADSPLFSTLAAQSAGDKSRGTALTIMNCIGFSITIISIQLVNVLLEYMNTGYAYLILAIGPIAGLIALRGNKKGHP